MLTYNHHGWNFYPWFFGFEISNFIRKFASKMKYELYEDIY